MNFSSCVGIALQLLKSRGDEMVSTCYLILFLCGILEDNLLWSILKDKLRVLCVLHLSFSFLCYYYTCFGIRQSLIPTWNHCEISCNWILSLYLWNIINDKIHHFYLNFCKTTRLNHCSEEVSLFKIRLVCIRQKALILVWDFHSSHNRHHLWKCLFIDECL